MSVQAEPAKSMGVRQKFGSIYVELKPLSERKKVPERLLKK